MANQHGFGYIGEFGIDDTLALIIREEDYGFTVSDCDIRNAEDGSLILSDLVVTDVSGSGIPTELRVLDSPPVLSVANGFVEGGCYQIILKNANGQSITTGNWEFGPSFCIGRQVTLEADTQYINRVSLGNGTVATVPDSLMGRVYTLELNQVLNISPKLRRILGLLGENQVVDAAFFDNASNVVSMRVRGYDTEDNARAAVRWVDTENESDPVGAFPTTGEQFRNVILASHDNPRQLRTELLGSISPEDGGSGDAMDQQYDSNSAL